MIKLLGIIVTELVTTHIAMNIGSNSPLHPLSPTHLRSSYDMATEPEPNLQTIISQQWTTGQQEQELTRRLDINFTTEL